MFHSGAADGDLYLAENDPHRRVGQHREPQSLQRAEGSVHLALRDPVLKLPWGTNQHKLFNTFA